MAVWSHASKALQIYIPLYLDFTTLDIYPCNNKDKN